MAKKWKDLGKRELSHLKKDGGVTTLSGFKRTAEEQKKMREAVPMFEPCWECKNIAQKLGLPV